MQNEQAPPDRLLIDVTIKGGQVNPTNAQLEAKTNEPIVVKVNSDVADELHVHSTPDHKFKVEAKPGAAVPVHGRRARQGRHRTASTGEDHRHGASPAVTDRPVAVLAHGLGGSTDLPIPYTYALIGAAWALTFTFAVVAFAWRQPRFDPDKPGRALPQWVTTVVDAPATRWALAAAGLAVRRLGGDGRVFRQA